MSRMLILNFSAFNSSAKQKSYYKFSAYDVEQKTLYDFFTEQQYCGTPDGDVPSDAECRSGFPKIAEVEYNFRQYQDSEGKTRYAPNVQRIVSWKAVDLKKL